MKLLFASLLILPLGLALSPALQQPPKYFEAVAAASVTPSPAFATLDYFEQKCSRCHGNYGANYSSDSLKKRAEDPKSLHNVLHEMAVGPGQAPLDDSQLEVLAAFHRSLAEAKPFVSITKIERDGDTVTLSGEATPNAEVSVVTGDQRGLATRDGHNWTVKMSGSEWESSKVQAKTGEIETEIVPSQTTFSQAKVNETK